jgi:hypothetical protein
MPTIGGGSISPLGGKKKMMLKDNAGADSFIIADSDGVPIFQVDSLGNVKIRGSVQKL